MRGATKPQDLVANKPLNRETCGRYLRSSALFLGARSRESRQKGEGIFTAQTLFSIRNAGIRNAF